MNKFVCICFFVFLLVGDFFFLEYYFLVRAAMVLFSFCMLLSSKSNIQNVIIKPYFFYSIIFLFLCLVHFCLIIYFGRTSISFIQIPRAISLLLQSFITLFFSYSLFRKFGPVSINIAVLAFIISYSICIINGLLLLGPIGLIEYAFDFSESKINAENLSLNKMFEIHTLGLTFPSFIAYYFIVKKEKNVKLFSNITLLVLFFFSLLTFKRISIGASIVIILLFYFGYSKRNIRRLNNFILISIILVSFIVLLIVYNPYFFEYIQKNGINLMGREYLYRGITTETELSIGFVGKGWGWVSSYMQYMNELSNSFVGIKGVHNDILRLYVELGFCSFVVYNIIFYYLIPRLFNKVSCRLTFYYILFQLFAFITYVTDNTLQYWDFQSVIIILPLCLYFTKSKPLPKI